MSEHEKEEAKASVNRFRAELSEADIAIIIAVSVTDLKKPERVPSEFLLDAMSEDDREMWLRAARATLQYIRVQFENAIMVN